MNPRTPLQAIVAAALLAPMAGCTQSASVTPTNEPVCLGFVIGQRANSPAVTGSMIGALIPEPNQLGAGSTIVVTGVSGAANGDAIYTGVVEDSGNSYDFEDSQINTRSSAITKASEAVASSPQADVLGAIEGTAAALRPSALSCTIHVLDSGLQTAGLVQFQQNLLDAGYEDVVARVPEAETLSGVTVVFDTLGAVVDPQPALDSESLNNLALTWEGLIAKRSGAFKQPSQVSTATRGTSATGLPEVDVVPVPDHSIDFSDLTPTCTVTSTTWKLPGDVLFASGSDDLKDSAKALLDPAAKILLEHPGATANLVGHSASVDAAPRVTQTSIERATAVKEYLVSQGVDDARITSEGVGDTDPICEDWDPATGKQVDACAAQERRVDLVVQGLVQCAG